MSATRRRVKQTLSLPERLRLHAKMLRDNASSPLHDETERMALIHKAQQYEAAAKVEGWLRSRELTAPS